MNTKQLEAAIAKKVERAQQLRLWEKAYEIVTKLGKPDTRVASSYTTVTHKLTVTVDGKAINIYKSNYVMGGDYMRIAVGGTQVFGASEKSKFDFGQRPVLEKHRIYRKLDRRPHEPEYVEVETYIEGAWEKLLDLKRISDVLRSESIVKEQQEHVAREREENARTLTEKEKEAAKAFGLSEK